MRIWERDAKGYRPDLPASGPRGNCVWGVPEVVWEEAPLLFRSVNLRGRCWCDTRRSRWLGSPAKGPGGRCHLPRPPPRAIRGPPQRLSGTFHSGPCQCLSGPDFRSCHQGTHVLSLFWWPSGVPQACHPQEKVLPQPPPPGQSRRRQIRSWVLLGERGLIFIPSVQLDRRLLIRHVVRATVILSRDFLRLFSALPQLRCSMHHSGQGVHSGASRDCSHQRVCGRQSPDWGLKHTSIFIFFPAEKEACLWEAPAWGEALTSSLPAWRGCAAILAPAPPARLSPAPHTGASTLVWRPGICHCCPGDASRRLVLAASVPVPTRPCLCVCRRAAAWSWVSCQPPSGAHWDPRRPHQDADKSGHSLTHWEP